jgi:hypothetical protein
MVAPIDYRLFTGVARSHYLLLLNLLENLMTRMDFLAFVTNG